MFAHDSPEGRAFARAVAAPRVWHWQYDRKPFSAETSQASLSNIWASFTESDKRSAQMFPPENIGAWFDDAGWLNVSLTDRDFEGLRNACGGFILDRSYELGSAAVTGDAPRLMRSELRAVVSEVGEAATRLAESLDKLKAEAMRPGQSTSRRGSKVRAIYHSFGRLLVKRWVGPTLRSYVWSTRGHGPVRPGEQFVTVNGRPAYAYLMESLGSVIQVGRGFDDDYRVDEGYGYVGSGIEDYLRSVGIHFRALASRERYWQHFPRPEKVADGDRARGEFLGQLRFAYEAVTGTSATLTDGSGGRRSPFHSFVASAMGYTAGIACRTPDGMLPDPEAFARGYQLAPIPSADTIRRSMRALGYWM